MKVSQVIAGIVSASCFALFSAEFLSLQATKISATPGALHITLENRAHQPVLGFCMKSRTATLILQEFAPPRSSGILAGSSFDTTLAIDPSLAHPETEVSSFAITCVLFEDGSTEGDNSDLAMLDQLRTGRELQTSRLLVILDEVRSSSDAQFAGAVQHAIDQIAAMDVTLENGTRAEGLVANGVRNTNTLFIQDLRQLQRVHAASGVGSARAHLEKSLSDQLSFRKTLTRTRMRKR